MRRRWSENEFELLSKTNIDLKTRLHEVFSNYQSSVIGTGEFPFLTHLTKHLESVGNIEYLRAGFYEATHKNARRLINEYLCGAAMH